MESQPYDNVEFPIRRPTGAGTWPSSAQNTSTKLYSQNILVKEKQGSTLEPLLEGDGGEVIEEDAELPQVEEQRQQATLIANQNKKDTTIDMNRGVYVVNTNQSSKHTAKSPPAAAQTTRTKSATLPATMTTSSSPIKSSKPVVVIEQPRPLTEEFTRKDFNPRSQDVLEEAYTRHSKFYKLNEKLMQHADDMKKEVWDVKGKPGEMLTYEQMIQGMLVDGEMLLLGGSWLYFSNLEFLDSEYKNNVKPSIGKGRICLTNQRLLILSAETDTDANLSTYDNPLTPKGGYKLALSKFNSIYFQNIPLSCFLSVELSAAVGTSQESRISYQKPLCCGLCSCFGRRCTDSWKASHPLPIAVNRRIVTLGVSMPPWQTQTSIVVHLHPDMPLTAARDFVSQLQQHAPLLH